MKLNIVNIECTLHSNRLAKEAQLKLLCGPEDGMMSDFVVQQRSWLINNAKSKGLFISDYYNQISFCMKQFDKALYIGGYRSKQAIANALSYYKSTNSKMFVHTSALFNSIPIEEADDIWLLTPQLNCYLLDRLRTLLTPTGTLHIFYTDSSPLATKLAMDYARRANMFELELTEQAKQFYELYQLNDETCCPELRIIDTPDLIDSLVETIPILFDTYDRLILVVEHGKQANNIKNLLQKRGIPIYTFLQQAAHSKFSLISRNQGLYLFTTRSLFNFYNKITFPVLFANPIANEFLYDPQLFMYPGPRFFYYFKQYTEDAVNTCIQLMHFTLLTKGTIYDGVATIRDSSEIAQDTIQS